ncbi:hypothetical protein Forpi1262_v005752 [Fusarium oxysporum f. sp. raphani]|uniref:Zn(2)-C6 fungal-type domain-containing protein n=1 Tax=Fusarium oxysporum f. sp. raphani TaxID=96318 RepID=A0A8J5UMZ6_FUSOX|nr:hypothetical protein Forpi1262_v005752 [Fusarium oxysporum f. sp. raphani]
MPGTPSGRGCDGCRRQKKKCDQAKPTCGRCKRVGVPCVGNGVKRWKFHSFQNDDQSLIKRRPSNEQTQLSSSLVHILQTEDARFDIRAFGGKLIPEIVAQIGCSPALDSCVNAMVSLYKSHRCQESRIDALTRYGEALTATRNAILDPKEKIIMKMQVVSIMFVCHYWVDPVMKNQLDDLGDYMVGLSQLAVMASFLNPQFELGPWFWEACETIGTPRPVKYHQGSFLSLESGTMGELSILMRSPKKNLRQLRCIYDVMQFEMPKVRQLLALATISTAAPNAPAMSTRVCSSYRVAYGILLAMTAVIGHTLRIWDTDLTLVGNSHDCVDECIALVEQCESARPYGANFVPDFLTMVWAAATDGYRNDEMAEYLVDYEKDSIGADFMGQAMSIRERLFAMEARETAKEVKLVLDPALESLVKRPVVSVQEIQPAVSECIIL